MPSVIDISGRSRNNKIFALYACISRFTEVCVRVKSGKIDEEKKISFHILFIYNFFAALSSLFLPPEEKNRMGSLSK